MVFKNYAKYYNLLYTDKDYESETAYIIELIKKHMSQAHTILDIGCGTGIHASLLAQNNYSVTGVDLSDDMVKIAKSKHYTNCSFEVGNARSFDFALKFDVITSLFHVISYQILNSALEEVFTNVRKHLSNDGLFIFDFWYAPAVLTQKPSVKIRRLEDKNIEVLRISEPIHYFNENIVNVNFDVQIKDKDTLRTESIKEQHKMRYFSIPELDFVLKKSGLEPIIYEEWLTKKVPSEKTWGVCCVTKKIV